MIIVTGATGNLGRLTIEEVLRSVPAEQVVAAVRSPDKAAYLAARGVQVREADYDRPETLTAAFAGVDRGLLLISGNEVGKRLPQHTAVDRGGPRGRRRALWPTLAACGAEDQPARPGRLSTRPPRQALQASSGSRTRCCATAGTPRTTTGQIRTRAEPGRDRRKRRRGPDRGGHPRRLRRGRGRRAAHRRRSREHGVRAVRRHRVEHARASPDEGQDRQRMIRGNAKSRLSTTMSARSAGRISSR